MQIIRRKGRPEHRSLGERAISPNQRRISFSPWFGPCLCSSLPFPHFRGGSLFCRCSLPSQPFLFSGGVPASTSKRILRGREGVFGTLMILWAAGGKVSGSQASCCLSTHHLRRWPRRVGHQPCPPALHSLQGHNCRRSSLTAGGSSPAIAALPDSCVSTGSEPHRRLSDECLAWEPYQVVRLLPTV